MDTHKNARSDPERSRGDGARRSGRRAELKPRPHGSSTPRRRQSPNGSSASARKAWMVCVIAPQDPFHRQTKPRRPHATRIEALRRAAPHRQEQIAVEVGDLSRRPSSRILRTAWASIKLSALEPAEPIRRYEREHAWRTYPSSTSKSSAGSARSGTASPDDILAPSTVIVASVGSSSMSASTMPHASRSCSSGPTSARRVLSPSWRPRSHITPSLESGLSVS